MRQRLERADIEPVGDARVKSEGLERLALEAGAGPGFAAVAADEDAPREAGGDDSLRVEGVDGDHLAEVTSPAVANEVGLFSEKTPGFAAVPGAMDETEAFAGARLAGAAKEDLGVVRTQRETLDRVMGGGGQSPVHRAEAAAAVLAEKHPRDIAARPDAPGRFRVGDQPGDVAATPDARVAPLRFDP